METITTEGLAKMLGITPGRVRQLVHEREIPYYKPLGRVLFLESDIVEWMSKHRVPSRSEIEQRADEYVSAKR